MITRIRRLLLLAPLALLGACGSSGSAQSPTTTAVPAASSTAVPSTAAPATTEAPPTTDVADTTATGAQRIKPGFSYLTVRDGVTLSINVVLPGSEKSGPYPTVLEYSGYEPSNPDSTASSALYNALGYAYVGVNMRGTGCSGGAFRFFEEKQLTDGYDAIETIAAQPWVQHHKVGMVGISYPGITQLFVASTQPPSLASIAPFSVSDDLYRSTLYPGGILNTGFAVTWSSERAKEAQPFGQAWTKKRADAGDTVCADNQEARSGNQDLTKEIGDNPFYNPAVADALNPSLLVGKINVPVFLAGAWQDEQTGGHFPAILDKFTSSPHVYATMSNGLHTEALGIGVLNRYYEFLDLYVAKRTPELSIMAGLLPSVLYKSVFNVSGLGFAPRRFTGKSYEEALAAFEAEPPVRILFEEGAADDLPAGAPAPRFEASFPSWPIPDTKATALPLVATRGSASYEYNPDATADTFYSGPLSDIWHADVAWDWKPAPKGAVVAFEGPTLRADQVVAGPASADLWISSTAADTDLEVTITEVRPDGQEMYVQSGWLRASQRALDTAASTELRPVHTNLEADAAPLVAGEPTAVRVELFPFAHVFRKGSRIRVVVGSPGGNRAQWSFQNLPAGGTVTVLTDRNHPSRVVLPVLPNIEAPAGLAACGSLRGQPCRAYSKLG